MSLWDGFVFWIGVKLAEAAWGLLGFVVVLLLYGLIYYVCTMKP